MQSLRRGIEVHSLNHILLDLSFANQLAEELGGLVALALDLNCLVALLVEILDAVVEANAQVVGGHAQDSAYCSRNSGGIGMHVVDLRELRLNLSGQTMGKRGGNLLKNICRGGNGWEG